MLVKLDHVPHVGAKIKKILEAYYLVGGFNPTEKYWSNWIISPNRDEHKEYLKPPPDYHGRQTSHLPRDYRHVCALWQSHRRYRKSGADESMHVFWRGAIFKWAAGHGKIYIQRIWKGLENSYPPTVNEMNHGKIAYLERKLFFSQNLVCGRKTRMLFVSPKPSNTCSD